MYEHWSLRESPYTTAPISRENLDLFVGRSEAVTAAQNTLRNPSVLVLEGGRGVGTTSLGNYLRFGKAQEGKVFSPLSEVSAPAGIAAEFFLANVLSTLVWTIDTDYDLEENPDYQTIKSITHQIRERYRDFSAQVSILGTGVGAGGNTQRIVVTPPTYPQPTLVRCLSDVKKLLTEYGVEEEIIVQVNNLDIGTTLSEEEGTHFLNAIRDILQIPGYSWILVGDLGLRHFIADRVDRLDDIVALEWLVEPLSLQEVYKVIEKRVHKYGIGRRPQAPLSDELIAMLYEATEGRIRQIFGFANRLLNRLADAPLMDRITPKIAFPLLRNEVERRMRQSKLTANEKRVLRCVTKAHARYPTEISKETNISRPNVSRILRRLVETRFLTFRPEGRQRRYVAMADVKLSLG